MYIRRIPKGTKPTDGLIVTNSKWYVPLSISNQKEMDIATEAMRMHVDKIIEKDSSAELELAALYKTTMYIYDESELDSATMILVFAELAHHFSKLYPKPNIHTHLTIQ